MKLHHIGLLTVAVFLTGAALRAAAPASVADLTKQLTGETAAAQRTPEQLAALYAQVLDALMLDMGAEDPGNRGGPSSTIERIAFYASRPGFEAERAACSKAIAARLGPSVAPPARVWLLRQLERIGRAEAVPQVAPLLADKDPLVRESARRALQKNSEVIDRRQRFRGADGHHEHIAFEPERQRLVLEREIAGRESNRLVRRFDFFQVDPLEAVAS